MFFTVLTNAQFVDMSKYVSGLKSSGEDSAGPSQGFTDALEIRTTDSSFPKYRIRDGPSIPS